MLSGEFLPLGQDPALLLKQKGGPPCPAWT